MKETYQFVPYHIQQTVLDFDAFANPFGARLRSDNKWIIRAGLVPWKELEERNGEVDAGPGRPFLPFRMALGALMVKELLGCTDRETVDAITENPYIQFFIGLGSFTVEEPFDHSSMTYFRKRINDDMIRKANELMVKTQVKAIEDEKAKVRKVLVETEMVQVDILDSSVPVPKIQMPAKTEQCTPECTQSITDENSANANKGTLIMDATCAPEDMRFPTDLGLLNDVRTFTEAFVTFLWARDSLQKNRGEKKPRTYRKEARINFLSAARKRKIKKNELRKTLRKQIGYCKRNISYIDALIKRMDERFKLEDKHTQRLAVASKIVEQQAELLKIKGVKGNERSSIPGRLVSFFKPHVRAIVRGKAAAPVEFGAKLSVSVNDGFVYLDRLSWDPYHEGSDLKMHAEEYRRRTGCYPEVILGDKAYHSRENREYCTQHNIRLGAPVLGRPNADETVLKSQAKQLRKDEIGRIEVEGKFGVAKRRFCLDKVMTRLQNSSECVISLVFMMINLEKLVALLFCVLPWVVKNQKFWGAFTIIFIKNEEIRHKTLAVAA